MLRVVVRSPERDLGLSLETGAAVMRARVPLPRPAVTRWDRESIRWYLEDYREFPAEPAPALAKESAALIERLGGELFSAVFTATPNAAAIWKLARDWMPTLDWEIDADLATLVPVPFEVLRDPATGVRPALAARSFTHVPRSSAGGAPRILDSPLRILIVIARPRQDLDVPFRSVAGRLLRDAIGEGRPRIDVLRPPTFDALESVLCRAKESREPYHLVHFDGHGVFGSTGAANPQGYAVFEDPAAPRNSRLIGGAKLGDALAKNGVEVLVLNACSSGREAEESEVFGSLARTSLESGLSAVVAMRYDVYVSTAATFVASFYDRIFHGQPLAQAASAARAELARDGDEWLVPVVVQANSVVMTGSAAATAPRKRPPPGFVGRDDMTLTIDRAFDQADAVLLWGSAGVGKSALAADFVTWYQVSRGDSRLMLWDGIEQIPPERVASDLAGLPGDGTVKLLMTSRDRTEQLPETVVRLHVRPLSAAESAELAVAIDPALIELCHGNPRALRLMRGFAPSDVSDLVSGRRAIDPSGEPAEALATFDPKARHILGLICMFRETIAAHHIARLHRALTEDQPPGLPHTEATALLDRVADLGWLVRLDADYFGIHPLLPSALLGLLDAWADVSDRVAIEKEFCRMFSAFGHGLFWSYHRSRDTLNIIALEEENLLRAFALALAHGPHDLVFGPLQALRMLYLQARRDNEFLALVTRLSPALLDAETLMPAASLTLSDRSTFGLLLDYSKALASSRDDKAALGRLATAQSTFLDDTGADHDPRLRQVGLRSKAVTLLESDSLDDLRRGLDLAHRSGDTSLEASALIAIGHAYRRKGELDRAGICFAEAHALVPETDRWLRIRVFDALGALKKTQANRLISEQLTKYVEQTKPGTGRFTLPLNEEQTDCLGEAYGYYSAALSLMAVEEADHRASLHHQLASLANLLDRWPDADAHYRQAIEGHDRAGDVFRGAQSRYDFANHLIHRGERKAEALQYARAASRTFESLGDQAGVRQSLESAKRLVRELES